MRRKKRKVVQCIKWRCTGRWDAVARGDIAVAVVMEYSPVWGCHGDAAREVESQQEAEGETGSNGDLSLTYDQSHTET